MPTYQYKREDGSMFEVFQSINDAALTHCPETGQPVQRVITGGGGVVYKGTGWYVTDYKNNSKSPSSESGSGSGSKETASESNSSSSSSSKTSETSSGAPSTATEAKS